MTEPIPVQSFPDQEAPPPRFNGARLFARSLFVERWRFVFVLYWVVGWLSGGFSFKYPWLCGLLWMSIFPCSMLNARHYKAMRNVTWF
jgi:hypothetical protein